jgi:membrane-associated phospholipid phosphatase
VFGPVWTTLYLLMGIALVREGRRLWVRVLGCLLPIAMALSVVVTANHYLLDVVVGMAIVVGALVVAHWMHQRRVRRRLVLTSHESYPHHPVTEAPLPVTPLAEKRAS